MSKRSKALEFPPEIRREIRERDQHCIYCGAPGTDTMHYIPRARGGLGVKENGALGCRRCHNTLDQSRTSNMGSPYETHFEAYLSLHYPGWNKDNLIYRKWEELPLTTGDNVLQRITKE